MDAPSYQITNPDTLASAWVNTLRGNVDLWITCPERQLPAKQVELQDILLADMEKGFVRQAPRLAEQFVEVFPNIGNRHSNNCGCLFISKWIDLLGSQLTEFHASMPMGETQPEAVSRAYQAYLLMSQNPRSSASQNQYRDPGVPTSIYPYQQLQLAVFPTKWRCTWLH